MLEHLDIGDLSHMIGYMWSYYVMVNNVYMLRPIVNGLSRISSLDHSMK